jgi:hypothetical protein
MAASARITRNSEGLGLLARPAQFSWRLARSEDWHQPSQRPSHGLRLCLTLQEKIPEAFFVALTDGPGGGVSQKQEPVPTSEKKAALTPGFYRGLGPARRVRLWSTSS